MTNDKRIIFDALHRRSESVGRMENDAVDLHIQQHRRGPQPRWDTDHVTRFVTKLTNAAGSYQFIPDQSSVPQAVKDYLIANQLDCDIAVAPHPAFQSLSWLPGQAVHYGAATINDIITLSMAFCGVAETGSIMMVSSPQTPTILNFLPDHFICVLNQKNIVAHLEDAWDKWRNDVADVSRVINFITGPSRTADVEQTIQLGAHGPRQLHLLLIKDG